MDDIFSNNAAIIKHRWPELHRTLLRQDPDELKAELAEGLGATLRVNGIQLTSRHDREKEAALQAETLSPDCEIAYLYGTGLGDLQLKLLSRPALKRLEVRILNLSLFALVIRLLDQRAWLADPRVSLGVAGDDKEIQLPFFALPAELQLADDSSAKIRDRLVADIEAPFVNRQLTRHDAHRQARLDSNVGLLEQDRDVAELFGQRQANEAYIIATGPSLEKHYEALKSKRRQASRPLFICVDTAFRPLMEQGIRPDIVVSIDHLIDETRLSPIDSAGIDLVYFPMVDNQVLRQWRGTRYAAYSNSPIFDALRATLPKASLDTGGSVIHPAVDLAVKIGVKNLVLFGADFAFPQDKTHAGWEDGALGPTVNTAKHWVLNGHGQRIKTLLSFRAYLCHLERYISQHPEVHFYNTSKEGAHVEGTVDHPEFVQ